MHAREVTTVSRVASFIRENSVWVAATAAFISMLVGYSVTMSVQSLRVQVSSERLQKEFAGVRRERDTILRQLNEAYVRVGRTTALTAQAEERITATTQDAEERIASLIEKVQGIDTRLRDFEAMIGTDDKVKVLMTTTAMAQEIAARKQFQDSIDSKLSAIRSDVEPIRAKLETLQSWLITSLLSVIIALIGVIWLLFRRAAALYGMVTMALPSQAD